MVVVSQTHRVRFISWNLSVCLAFFIGCSRHADREVVLYTSQDRVYAEPILRQFTRETGIEVKALYDSEAAKTVGLANRLLAENSHPQCDVFWNNEELRTWQLAAKGVLQTNWVTLGHRTREIVFNTNLVRLQNAPQNLIELTNSAWLGKVALAYPQFGTTATHFLALRQAWGHVRWEKWCRALRANKPFLVNGNSVVVNLVGRGEAALGITDSDDIAAGQNEGLPIAGIPTEMQIPNTIALTSRPPHATEGQQLITYLSRPEVVNQLIAAHALDSPEPPGTSGPALSVKYPQLVRELEKATHTLEQIFLK